MIDASGAGRPHDRFYRDFADRPAYASHAAQDGFATNEELHEFLTRTFEGGARQSHPHRTFQARGQDVSYVLPVGPGESEWCRAQYASEGKTLQVTIPESADDHQALRLKGEGMPGFGGGPPGDAYIELHVEPPVFFTGRTTIYMSKFASP